MSLKNYRENEILINGQKVAIGAFARPQKGFKDFNELLIDHGVQSVISLTGDYSSAFNMAELSGSYTYGKSVDVYDWYDTPFEETEPIPVSVYDAVYESVLEAQKNGKKVAIHCGAGDGRTGTALV